MIAPIDQYLSIDPIVAGQGRFLTVQPPNPVQQVLVRGVGVDDGGEGADVASESLGQEQIPGCSVHIRNGSVTQCVQGIEATEPRLDLCASERMLNPALGDALSALVAEER